MEKNNNLKQLTHIEINHGNQYNFNENSIEDCYAGSIIFITGATGFLGKALLEKLLRSCKKISVIYILLRSKNGQTIQQRLEKLMDNLIFDRIKFEYPDCFKKVIPINGDISKMKLGLSENDYCLLFEKVNIVFHCAATVGFNDPFKIAINQNVGGTKQVIDLCLKMLNLKSFVYVSTAYSNSNIFEIDEKIYPTKFKPEFILDVCKTFDDEIVNFLAIKLQDKHPNTYTLTKNFAENLINNYEDKLPIAIVRPSIISGAVQEPFPGWVDNFIGATGVMAQVGVGLAKSMFGEENKIVDLIPIDIVVNTLICASWNNMIQPSNKIQVYNCVSGPFNPLRWKRCHKLTAKYAIESPSKHVVLYPGTIFTSNRLLHNIIVFFCHYVVAFMLDLLDMCQRQKPRMLKLVKRNERMQNAYDFFKCNDFNFHGKNMKQLVEKVKLTKNHKTFNIDAEKFDWDENICNCILGINKFLFKENTDNLQITKNYLNKLFWIWKFIQAFLVIGIIIFLYFISSLIIN